MARFTSPKFVSRENKGTASVGGKRKQKTADARLLGGWGWGGGSPGRPFCARQVTETPRINQRWRERGEGEGEESTKRERMLKERIKREYKDGGTV